MSDVQDVCDALVNLVAFACYPTAFDSDGSFDKGAQWDQPYTESVAETKWNSGVTWNSGRKWNARKIPSVSGTPIVIYPGWPSSAGLDDALTNQKSHVTVFPKAEERNTTRYLELEQVVTDPAPTLRLRISGPIIIGNAPDFDVDNVTWDMSGSLYDQGTIRHTVVTVEGTVSSPQNVALRINGKFYVYAVLPKDTLQSIAAALGALVLVDIAGTTVANGTITLGGTARLQAARIGGFGTVGTEYRRQERVLMVSIWSYSPAARRAIASAIDQATAQIRFVALPDGFSARLIYKNSLEVDGLQKANLYRRDINFLVEYPTTITKQVAAVIAPQAIINGTPFTY